MNIKYGNMKLYEYGIRIYIFIWMITFMHSLLYEYGNMTLYEYVNMKFTYIVCFWMITFSCIQL